MIHHLTAIIEREGDGYVSLCPELDIASQAIPFRKRGTTERALQLFFECAPPEEIGRRMREKSTSHVSRCLLGKLRALWA